MLASHRCFLPWESEELDVGLFTTPIRPHQDHLPVGRNSMTGATIGDNQLFFDCLNDVPGLSDGH